ncbi:MAG TPA: DNA polymerase III subunit delta' C-terminal domain-containing protein [Gammaproteobacteria bacterium]|nr:DNA polymerase III subunit delta' C-terminal domain-containing protein [Gammaproteobacteria bacterium]
MLPLAKLQALSLANALPHAWIFSGADSAALLKEANEFTQWLLCNNKHANVACGSCKACHLFSAQTHPDFCNITPQQDKTSITIDAMRSVADFAVGKPQLSQCKVVLLYPADAMPVQSANALLKTLEEPRGATIFLLLTRHPELLLKTIVSRCHVLHSSSQPLRNEQTGIVTRQMATDLCKLWLDKRVTCSQIVEQWLKQWPDEVLYWLDIVLTDMIRFKYTNNIVLAKAWCMEQERLSKALASSKFWTILERLRQAQSCFGRNLRPNLQLVLEDMLLVT